MANWNKLPSSGNVEDRRSNVPLAVGGGSLGIVGIVIYLVMAFAGGDPSSGDLNTILTQLQQTQGVEQQTGDSSQFAGKDTYEQFASEVLGSTDVLWSEVFAQNSKSYIKPKLVLFRQATQSACGGADSRVGPHFCPADNNIYLDETFFDELKNKLGATGGDVAEAYVIAHEVGHNVQKQLGIMSRVASDGSNQASVAMELQADCFAGVWAKSVSKQGVIEPGEIAEAQNAAAAVGDDRIQAASGGRVNPESWTHGSSAERLKWFNTGYDTASPARCDTFSRS